MKKNRIALKLWLECSKQTRLHKFVSWPSGLTVALKRNLLEQWVDEVHPQCTGYLSYGWKYGKKEES